MTNPIYEWPRDWYTFTSIRPNLQSRSQSAQSPWTGRRSVYGPHAQMWVFEMTLNQMDEERWRQTTAFFSRLDGTNGLMRIACAGRLRPYYNIATAASSSAFSDGTFFTDGSGFESGLLPPTAFVAVAALRGDKNLQIGGLPASIARALRRGDLLEVRPNGVSGEIPHLYEVQVDGSTDADGLTGVEIRPRLRANLAVGDQVVLEYATSVFRAIDENQNQMEITPPVFGNLGFKLVENLP